MDDLQAALEPLFAKLAAWWTLSIALIPNALVAAVVVAVAWILSLGAGRLVGRGLHRVTNNDQVSKLLATVTRLVVMLVGVFVALELLQLEKAVTSLLAGVGVLGLALGFAFQDLAANFVSGVYLAFRRPFRIGDQIRTGDIFGRVAETDLRSTTILTLTGEHVMVPNRDLFEKALTNYTLAPTRRVDLEVGVSYGDDLAKVRQVTHDAVLDIPLRDPAREVEVFFTGFGESSIGLEVRIWITEAMQVAYMTARSDAVMRIKAAYDANGITIPFPIRTIDFADREQRQAAVELARGRAP